jgi:hypothetical protein
MSTVPSARSRYHRVPVVTLADLRRGAVVVTEARPLPATTPALQHTLAAGDRLDRLAWTFYGDPLQLWRICDANPDFLSPLALMGQEASTTVGLPVVTPGDGPPWAPMLATLTATVGVDDVVVDERYTLEHERRSVDGTVVTVTVERPARTVVVTYNARNVGVAELARLIEEAGFTVGPPIPGGREGLSVVVPVADPG